MVPRLKIDMVPSHHLKNQKANTNSLSNLHMQSSASLTSSKSTSKLSTRQLGSATFSQNSASHLMSQVAHLLESGSQKILKNKQQGCSKKEFSTRKDLALTSIYFGSLTFKFSLDSFVICRQFSESFFKKPKFTKESMLLVFNLLMYLF